jgi:hypothetical protein
LNQVSSTPETMFHPPRYLEEIQVAHQRQCVFGKSTSRPDSKHISGNNSRLAQLSGHLSREER